MAAQVASGGGGNAAFKVPDRWPALATHALTRAAGQGEAPSSAEREHHCCQRYAITSGLLQRPQLTHSAQPWPMPFEQYVPRRGAGDHEPALLTRWQSLGPKGMDKMVCFCSLAARRLAVLVLVLV